MADTLERLNSDEHFEGGEINEKMRQLDEIEKEMLLLKLRLERFPERKKTALTKICATKWLMEVKNRPLKNFETYMAKKIRTNVGLSGEEFMKILFKLDQVESGGFPEVKYRRRGLVQKINNDLLPLCDKYLLEAQTVVTLYNKINRIIAAKNEKKMDIDDIRAEIKEEATNDEAEVRNESSSSSSDSDSSDDDEDKQESNNQVEIEKSEEPLESKAHEHELRKSGSEANITSSHERARPEYQIEQREGAVVIHLLLPSNELADDLQFQLHGYNSELNVIGNNFELPFQINSDKYLLDESKIKIISPQKVLIYIPKKRYSFVNPYQRQRSRQIPQAYGYPFSRRSQPSFGFERNPVFGGFF